MNTKTILWSTLTTLLVLIIGMLIYKAWPLLYPPAISHAPLDPTCDLRAGPCTSSLQDGASISFSINPKDIPVLKPLQLHVELSGITADKIEVDFSGVGMGMGFNRALLTKDDATHFSGKGMLSICVRDAMEWDATVMVYTDNGVINAPFRFITVKTGLD